MKLLIFLSLFSILLFAQDNPDSLKQVEIKTDYLMIQKQYQSTDSLQIKRLGIMEYLQSKYQTIEQKKKKK